ncbi:ionotropic receptor 21a-like [Penaeus vannamei]|uniref:ionotropic receptor 21a-like n=1 Tax=Penaeus vannamei TaxID=6689 RepID=UPI00387F5A64
MRCSTLQVNYQKALRKLSWCVNVVVLSEDFTFLTTFAESSLQGRLLEWATRLMVVTRLPLQELHQLLKNYWTFSMMNTIVIHAGGAPRGPWCSVYTYLPYSPAGGQVKLVASWTPVKGLLPLTDLPFFYDKFSNFYGATMNVTAKDYKPYWFELKEEAADGSKKLTGMDYLLLETVAKALNFSIKVLPIANWAEALDRVVSKEAFITPVIHAVLRQRLKRFEYTIPYTYASYSLSMKMPELTPQWQSLYYPLAGIVWVSVVVVTGLMIVVMYVMNKVGDFSSPPRRLEPGTVVLEVVGALFYQNLFKTLPTTDPSRVLVVFWLIFAFVVGTAYRGNLTAALTLPKYPLKPETLSEVVEVVHKVTIEPWGKDYKTFFKESGTEVFMKLADMMELGPALLDGLQEATEDASNVGSQLRIF